MIPRHFFLNILCKWTPFYESPSGYERFEHFGFQYSDKRQHYIRIFMKNLIFTYLPLRIFLRQSHPRCLSPACWPLSPSPRGQPPSSYHTWPDQEKSVRVYCIQYDVGLYLHLLHDSLLLLVILGLVKRRITSILHTVWWWPLSPSPPGQPPSSCHT